jgi:excisionase family DNA binding protein
MARPKGPDRAALSARGVTLAENEAGSYTLTCGQCGATWDVAPAGGRLPAGYWHCPNACNTAQPAARQPRAALAVPTDLASVPAILTPAEAAALLRVSENTVKDWARAGDLPGAFKLGKVWRVERDALLAHIRAG